MALKALTCSLRDALTDILYSLEPQNINKAEHFCVATSRATTVFWLI